MSAVHMGEAITLATGHARVWGYYGGPPSVGLTLSIGAAAIDIKLTPSEARAIAGALRESAAIAEAEARIERDQLLGEVSA